MAKSDAPEMVTIPAEEWKRLQARLDQLEASSRFAVEAVTNSRAKIIDQSYEEWKAQAGRPASERTQEVADKLYGREGQRFRVTLDSTLEDGKPGPNVREHFPLLLSANSDLEAQARYQQVMGIKKHDYRLRCEPVAVV